MVAKIADGCGFAFDTARASGHLFTLIAAGEKAGIYQYSLTEKKCTMLVPGVVSFALTVARDGKSIVYAVPSQRLVAVYRQKWQNGKAVGQPQVAAKLPFAFPLTTGAMPMILRAIVPPWSTTVVFSGKFWHS
jgi:hypothetical protein